jgi:hypothetical protein
LASQKIPKKGCCAAKALARPKSEAAGHSLEKFGVADNLDMLKPRRPGRNRALEEISFYEDARSDFA